MRRGGGGANGGPFFRGGRGGGGPPRYGNPNFEPGWGPPPMYGPPPGMGYGNQMELWVETKTEDGKSYYYHAMTRETTWTRPEGPHIKIMSQTEVEAMSATKNQQHQQMPHQQQQQVQHQQQNPPQQQQQNSAQNNLAEHLEEGAIPGNEAKPESNGQSGPEESNIAGNAQQTSGESPHMDTPQQAQPQQQQQSPQIVPMAQPTQIPPQIPPQMAPFTSPPPFAPQYGMPPPGFGGFPPGGWRPPHDTSVSRIPAWGENMPELMMQQYQQPLGEPAKSLIAKPGVIEPQVIARAAEWSEHRAPDGRPYYYHATRGESVWEKPQAIRDLEGNFCTINIYLFNILNLHSNA